jgi:hypothetical protein
MSRAVSAILLLGACSDAGVTKHNALPTAEIASLGGPMPAASRAEGA